MAGDDRQVDDTHLPPIPLTPEATRILRLMFAPRDREAAWHMLVAQLGRNLGFPRHLGPAVYDRVRLAAMKSSDGTLEGLQRALTMGALDWRDLLVDAGFADDARAHLRWLADGSDEARAAEARWKRPHPLAGRALARVPGLVLNPPRDPDPNGGLTFTIHGVPALQFVEALLTELHAGEIVALPDPEDDCGRYVRRAGSAWQTKIICHGRFLDPWHDATRVQAVAWLLPAADHMVNHRHGEGWIEFADD